MTELFINEFQKGSSENANIGKGTILGVETYSVKGTARLTKDSTSVAVGVVTDLPLFVVCGAVSSTIFVQGDTGKVYRSTNSGATWTDISAGGTTVGQGLAFFKNDTGSGYLFAFHDGKIDYYNVGTATWFTNWQPNGVAPVIYSTSNVVPTILFPNDGFIYFGNGHKVGKLGYGTAPTFDPAGAGGTDYFYSDNFSGVNGLLPNLYTITSISFLPNNYIALGTSSSQNSAVADVILWNPTLSTYETPLRLYSQAPDGLNGVKQLINRNNVLYAVVGGSQSIFSTNGSSFQLVADLSLYSNIRQPGGNQAQVPVFLNPLVSAIDVFGNKLLTGMSTPNSIAYYPAGYGLYPCGVWSVAFAEDGNAIQCEYVISTNTTVAQNQFRIGFIKCTDSNQTLIGWRDNASFGIDLVSTTAFQNTLADTAIESEMMEIGTPLDPDVIPSIQLNTPRQLLTGQSVAFSYRTGFDQDYTALETFTSANNNDNGYKIVSNDIGATRFLQLKVQMASTSDTKFSPEIRNIIISKQ